jgi:hypothetical protein
MKKESMFIIGMFSIIVSLILGIISGDIELLNFFEGFFYGLSMVMNVGFLIKYRLEKNYINDNFNKKS